MDPLCCYEVVRVVGMYAANREELRSTHRSSKFQRHNGLKLTNGRYLFLGSDPIDIVNRCATNMEK